MAAAKRASAFNRAMREAQPQTENASDQEHEEIAYQGQPPAQEFDQPSPVITKAPASTPAPATINKGGRPKGKKEKRKFTYYLESNADETITTIKKALVRQADTLVDDKGEVVDQALQVMRFALENEECREAFLEIYQRWNEAKGSK